MVGLLKRYERKSEVLHEKPHEKSLFQIRNIQKKMQSLEGQFDSCTEQLFEATVKLEQKEKVHLKLDGLLWYFIVVST